MVKVTCCASKTYRLGIITIVNQDLAEARNIRKRNAAAIRKEIRGTVKSINSIVKDLGKPKADVWSLSIRLTAKAKELSVLQKGLNAILNHGDELKILKKVASKISPPMNVLTYSVSCEKCYHGLHNTPCEEQVLNEMCPDVRF